MRSTSQVFFRAPLDLGLSELFPVVRLGFWVSGGRFPPSDLGLENMSLAAWGGGVGEQEASVGSGCVQAL